MSISAIRFSHLGQSIQRQATTLNSGEGVTKHKVELTRANGNEISRERTVTRIDGEATKIDGSITTARGTTSYSGTLDKDLQKAELAVTGPKGNTKTVTLQRQTGYEPRPGAPITLDPVKPVVPASAVAASTDTVDGVPVTVTKLSAATTPVEYKAAMDKITSSVGMMKALADAGVSDPTKLEILTIVKPSNPGEVKLLQGSLKPVEQPPVTTGGITVTKIGVIPTPTRAQGSAVQIDQPISLYPVTDVAATKSQGIPVTMDLPYPFPVNELA